MKRFILPFITAFLLVGCTSPFQKEVMLDESKCVSVISNGVPVLYQCNPKELLSEQHESKKECFTQEYCNKRLDTSNNEVFDTCYKAGYDIKTESRVSDIGVTSNKDGKATFIAVVNNFSNGYSISFPVEVTVNDQYKICDILEYNRIE